MNGGGSAPNKHASIKDWLDMVNEFQQAALATRLGIPLIYGIDVVHGHNNVINATILPHNVGLGVTRDPLLIKKIGVATALELRPTGIPYAFALHCMFVCRTKVAGCAKHYVGDGGTAKGINENNTIVDHTGLFGIHMPAYLDSLAKGVATVMAFYSSINELRCMLIVTCLPDSSKANLVSR
ncbi:hypothetical protein PTKIN_Ptkin09bG0190800 [Pterospermum kingtungense]